MTCHLVFFIFSFHYSGYVPDTDSELGTLTLNSPQEWMEKGYHGNLEQLPEMTSIQKNLFKDYQGKEWDINSIVIIFGFHLKLHVYSV